MKTIPINQLIESFADMPPEGKGAVLQDILVNERCDAKIREWLREVLKSEQNDAVRAMVVELLGIHIDKPEIRDDLESLLPVLPRNSLSYNGITELLLTALTDDMEDVKRWGIRLVREYEKTDPEDEDELFHFLAENLEDETMLPRFRWQAALVLAHIGTRPAIEKLIGFGKALTLRVPVFENAEESFGDLVNRFLMEKVAYSLGAASEKVAAYRKRGEVLRMLAEMSERTYNVQELPNPVTWAVNEIKKTDEERGMASLLEKMKRIPSVISQYCSIPKIIPLMAATCLVLALISNGLEGPETSISVVKGKASVQTRGKSIPDSEVELEKGEVLESGEFFRINIRTDEGGHAYVLSYSSSGDINKLFFKKTVDNEVHVHPDEYQLDEQRGTETLFLLTSEKPIDGFDEKFEELRNAGISEIEKIFPEASVQSFSFRHE